MIDKKNISNIITSLSHAMVCLGHAATEDNTQSRKHQCGLAKKLVEKAFNEFASNVELPEPKLTADEKKKIIGVLEEFQFESVADCGIEELIAKLEGKTKEDHEHAQARKERKV